MIGSQAKCLNWEMVHKGEVKVERIDWAKIRKKEVSKVLYHGDVEGMQKMEWIIYIFECVTALFDEALGIEKHIFKTEMAYVWQEIYSTQTSGRIK